MEQEKLPGANKPIGQNWVTGLSLTETLLRWSQTLGLSSVVVGESGTSTVGCVSHVEARPEKSPAVGGRAGSQVYTEED